MYIYIYTHTYIVLLIYIYINTVFTVILHVHLDRKWFHTLGWPDLQSLWVSWAKESSSQTTHRAAFEILQAIFGVVCTFLHDGVTSKPVCGLLAVSQAERLIHCAETYPQILGCVDEWNVTGRTLGCCPEICEFHFTSKQLMRWMWIEVVWYLACL